jgi:hypothetical protein
METSDHLDTNPTPKNHIDMKLKKNLTPSVATPKLKQGVAWFNKVEEYFEIYSINSDNKKIKYDFMQLEGDAYNWCIWWKKTSFFISWNTFKDDFFKRFKGIKDEDFSIELTRLQQKGNVDKFTCDWETLAT